MLERSTAPVLGHNAFQGYENEMQRDGKNVICSCKVYAVVPVNFKRISLISFNMGNSFLETSFNSSIFCRSAR